MVNIYAPLPEAPMYDVLVPILDEYGQARKIVVWASSRENVGQIIVSVNQPRECDKKLFLALQDEFSNCLVFLQEHNLGLYGNFRFLVEKSDARWVQFWASDDFHPPLEASLDSLGGEHDLLVPRQERVEVFRDDYEVFGTITLGDSKGPLWEPKNWIGLKASDCKVLDCPPAWIFGYWRRETLGHIFPEDDFNWLDSAMLATLAVRGKITILEEIPSSRMGEFPGRAPHAVGRNHLSPWKWLARVFPLVAEGLSLKCLVRNWRFLAYLKRFISLESRG